MVPDGLHLLHIFDSSVHHHAPWYKIMETGIFDKYWERLDSDERASRIVMRIRALDDSAATKLITELMRRERKEYGDQIEMEMSERD